MTITTEEVLARQHLLSVLEERERTTWQEKRDTMASYYKHIGRGEPKRHVVEALIVAAGDAHDDIIWVDI